MLADDPARPEADKLPLALRTQVVRQLSSTRYRRGVRQVMGRSALVVGNPSVANFGASFAGPNGQPLADPPPLAGAEEEAHAIARVLGGLGYTVRTEIGEDRQASDVMAALYRAPYRILHVSAHGVFDLPHRDGCSRSGIVLSDGLLITAAEIDAMETVPELVFLNCCHLAKVDIGRDGNKLAASIARQLIDIGVRCVVVAGWAVNDATAREFGETFYRELLMQRKSFGEAVFAARCAVWKGVGQDITWGAFQAYGDPGWRADPRLDGATPFGEQSYATPDEMLDELARARIEFARKRDRQSEREAKRQIDAIEQSLKRRCPPSWLALPQLQSALGATWRDVGQFERARAAYLAAIRSEDRVGYVPIRDIEQLANVEARLGERKGDIALVELALERLAKLDSLVGAPPDPELVPIVNVERSAIRGSAWKRKASIYARELLSGKLAPNAVKVTSEKMRAALAESVTAYREAEGAPGGAQFDPYTMLNRLALEALTPWPFPEARAQAIDLAQQCRKAAAAKLARSPDVWSAVMQPEALLMERLIEGRLGESGEGGNTALEEVAIAYAEGFANVPITPAQLDSVVTNLELLSRFFAALALAEPRGALARTAGRLLELTERIRPGRAPRGSRPAPQRSAAAPERQRRRPAKRAKRAARRRR
jgi:hypothetical protein